MRCGTSTLYNLLIQHPQCCKPKSKEINFFLTGNVDDLAYYLKKLGAGKKDCVTIDISPSYITDEDIPEKIKTLLGDSVKFIFMVRNPFTRLKSQYYMEKRLDHENLEFEVALTRSKKEKEALSLKTYGHKHGFNYLKSSMYDSVIKNYINVFSKENIKVVVFENFISDPQSSMVDICNFIGINPGFSFDYNVGTNPNKTATKNIFFDKAVNKIKKIAFIRKSNWKPSKARKILAKVKSKIVNYEEIDYRTEIEIPVEIQEVIRNEIAKLQETLDLDLRHWF